MAKNYPSNKVRIWLLNRCNYSIKNTCYIGEDLIVIDDPQDRDITLTIEDRVSLAPGIRLVLHSIPERSRIKDYVNGKIGKIWIESDAWIGVGAVILPNVRICEGAVVLPNAVVTNDVPPYTMVGGIPARKIKTIDVPWYET
ncbi:MAG: acyltransferase [Colwellia sp.]|nr:acyltransferase [Colwellia sp.]